MLDVHYLFIELFCRNELQTITRSLETEKLVKTLRNFFIPTVISLNDIKNWYTILEVQNEVQDISNLKLGLQSCCIR